MPGGSYRIEITGEPSYALDLCLSSPHGDHNRAGLVATEPGIRSLLDTPLVTGKGLYASPIR